MRIDRELCDVCGTCVSVCPVDAIRVTEFEVILDRTRCIKCRNCQTVCPFKAIGEEA